MQLSGIIINNKYRIKNLVNADSIRNIYSATDITQETNEVQITVYQNEAALKRTEDIVRFKSLISDIIGKSDKHVLSFFDVGNIFESPFVVHEVIGGESLAAIIQKGLYSQREVVKWTIEIAQGLAFLHKNKIIHRHLTPESLFIFKKNIKIIDIGTANLYNFNKDIYQDKIIHICKFLAPEQTGILKRTIDERSDLFSLGIIMYWMLTKSLPFEGNDICSIMHSQALQQTIKPSQHNNSIYSVLDEIILKLINKIPENRYQTARGLLHDLERLSDGVFDFLPGANDHSIHISYQADLIGRENELKQISSLLETVNEGNSAVCFISGEAGIGKTRLIEEFEQLTYKEDFPLLFSKCFEGQEDIPYCPIIDLMDSFITVFNSYSKERKKMLASYFHTEFQDLGEILVKLNPAIITIIGETLPLLPLDKDSENQRFLDVLNSFFITISKIEKKLVIVIEDVQWSDVGSLAILNKILENIGPLQILIIFTFNNEGNTENKNILHLRQIIKTKALQSVDISLSPLTLHKTNELVSSILRCNINMTRDISKYIFRKSKGNVLFSLTAIRQFIEREIISIDHDRWIFNKKKYKEIELPSTLLDVILTRMDLLNEIEKNILAYAAVIGKEFNLSLLFILCSPDKGVVIDSIDKAVQLQIIEVHQTLHHTYIFSHDRIREALYENMQKKKQSNAHCKVAEALEDIYKENISEVIFKLVYHFKEGGNHKKTLYYAYPAGIRALESYAINEAYTYFQIIITFIGDDKKNPLWFDCREKLGFIFILKGEYDNAIVCYKEIISNIEDDQKRPAILIQLADVYYRKGQYKECESAAIQGLAIFNERIPMNQTQLILQNIWEICKQLAHYIFLRGYRKENDSADIEKYKMIVNFYKVLTHNYTIDYKPKIFLLTALRMVNISETKLGLSRELAISKYIMGFICIGINLISTSLKYFNMARQISIDINDQWCKAYYYILAGYVKEFTGEIRSAIDDYYMKSLALFRDIGDNKYIHMVASGLARSYYYLSEYEDSLQYNDLYASIAEKSGDHYLLGTAYLNYAMNYRVLGNIETAVTYINKAIEVSKSNNIMIVYCPSLVEKGILALESGEISSAITLLEEACNLYERTTIPGHFIVHLYSYLSEARIKDYIMKEENFSNYEKKQYIKKIKNLNQIALKKAKKLPLYYPLACRVNGILFSLLKQFKKAEEMLRKGIELSEHVGTKYETAKGLLEYGLLLNQMNRNADSRKQLEKAYIIFKSIGAKLYTSKTGYILGIKPENFRESPLSKLIHEERQERLEQLQRMIEKINDSSKITEKILTKTIEISGAHGGHLFLIDSKSGDLLLNKSNTKKTLPPILDLIKNIAETAITKDNYIIVDSEQITEIIKKAGTNTKAPFENVLCIPLKIQDTIIGAFCIEDPYDNSLLPESEILIIQEILSRAGELLQNKTKQSLTGINNSTPVLTIATENKIKKAIKYINDNYTSHISRDGLAISLDLSPNYFGRLFLLYTGKSFSDYINNLRIKKAMDMLTQGKDKIIDIAFSVGFENLRTFNRVFSKIAKITPKKFRNSKIH